MESDRELNSELLAINAIPDNELDDLLQIDIEPRNVVIDEQNNISSLMTFNREPFPSQSNSQKNINDDEILDFNFDFERAEFNLSFPITQNANSSSLIITTQEVEKIVIIDTENPAENTIAQPAAANNTLSSAKVSEENILNNNIEQQSTQTSTQNSCHDRATSCASLKFSNIDTKNETLNFSLATNKFGAHFNFEDEQLNDLELPPLDIDFEQLDALERTHASSQNANAAVFKSQPTKQQQEIAPPNLMNSCPARLALSPSSSYPLSIQNDPLNYITVDYSKSSQASTSSYNQMLVANMPQRYSPSLNTKQTSQRSSHNSPASVAPSTPTLPNNSYHFDNTALQSAATADVELTIQDHSTADVTMIPKAVNDLYNLIKAKYSDFAFVYALSAQLCQDRVPMDCFVGLKMGLLLSLASIGPNPDRAPIPIVAVGNDTYMANYLLSNIGEMAPRFVGPVLDVKPPASSAAYRNHKWIEADPILLAKGGVFYVGDWSQLKMARADKIFKYIECSSVAIENSNHTYPLETAIWTHWRSFKFNSKDQQTFNKIVKIFGIPIYMDDANHEVLVNYTLEQVSVHMFESSVDHLSIGSEDMRNFVAVIAKRTVDLTAEASELLQKYFVASRIARPDCLSKQAFVVLKQFAESFAKLSLRYEVLTIDVVAAIYMCEHFIQNIYGANDNPPPTFESHNFVGLVDKYMCDFQQWLQNYIAIYYDKQ